MVRKLMVRGVLLLALASVAHYLWNGITGDAPDRWSGAAMIFMVIALNLITPVVLIAVFSTPRTERLISQQRLFERLGQHDLVEGMRQAQEWRNPLDPMSHPLYHSNTGIPVRITHLTDTHQAIGPNPVIRLGVRRGDTPCTTFEVTAVVPRIAIPRVGDLVRVLEHPNAPGHYRYAGPVAE